MTLRLLPTLGNFVQLLVEGYGKPRVHEDGEVRCLRFSSGVVQSAMRIADPYALDLSYTRSMMGFLLFNEQPRHILIVGLGGGSLSKYCYREFPQARITTLEISPEVLALREQFLIPADDGRFQVIQADGCEYLSRGNVQADVILLDGFDAEGMPECLCAPAFYADCWRALSAQGVLVANLWRDEPRRQVYVDRLSTLFDGRVWWSRPPGSSNLIAFAVKNNRFYPQWSRLVASAQALDERHALDLIRVVRDMRERPDLDA